MFKFSMTIPQFLEFQKLKQENQYNKKQLYIAISSSFLCFCKTLFEQLGYDDIAFKFLLTSKYFFSFLILISIIDGIEKTRYKETKKAGLFQLVGNVISIFIIIKA